MQTLCCNHEVNSAFFFFIRLDVSCCTFSGNGLWFFHAADGVRVLSQFNAFSLYK